MSKQECGRLTTKMAKLEKPPITADKNGESWTDQETDLVIQGKSGGDNAARPL